MSGGPFGRHPGEPPAQEPAPETPPPPPPRRPPPPSGRMPSPSTWIVGVLLVGILVYVAFNSLTTDGPGSEGVVVGRDIPPFAAPLALANVECEGEEECDANVLLQESDGVPQACDVRGPDIVNSCELTEDGPLVLAFLVEPSQRCIDQVDVLDDLAPRFPDVSFAAVAIRGDHAALNALIRERGWELPVAYDHDGAVANAFAVAICPTITFAAQGGAVKKTTLGASTEAEIVKEIRLLR
ncbi:MAG: hypothetical protein WKF94_07875 [Solirubrobacteraceae bacterium]